MVFAMIIFSVTVFGQQVVDSLNYGGKKYHIVKIGNQEWFQENLEYGKLINRHVLQTNNNIVEKYYILDDSINYSKYGAFYSWSEAMNYSTIEGSQGICPKGYHIPTKADFEELFKYVGIMNVNGLLAIGQYEGTNTTKFSVMLSGFITDDGYSVLLTQNFAFWTSTLYSGNDCPYQARSDKYGPLIVEGIYYMKTYYLNIRPIKDKPIVVVNNETELPQSYSLSQNYPNPFNSSSIIRYSIKESGNVTINITDILGRQILVLVNEFKNPGEYSVSVDNSKISSGIYFYTMKSGNFSQTKKMIVLK
jgi:uncharacterized protein (TIGR02145 family)